MNPTTAFAFGCVYGNFRLSVDARHRMTLSVVALNAELLAYLEKRFGGTVCGRRWQFSNQKRLLSFLKVLRKMDGVDYRYREYRIPEVEAAIRFLELRKNWRPTPLRPDPPASLLAAEAAFRQERAR